MTVEPIRNDVELDGIIVKSTTSSTVKLDDRAIIWLLNQVGIVVPATANVTYSDDDLDGVVNDVYPVVVEWSA